MTSSDHYKTLQVDPEAEPDIIQAAYRRLARKYHPDVASDPAAALRMAAINGAWDVLGDPARRAAYDIERAERAARQAHGGSDAGNRAAAASAPAPDTSRRRPAGSGPVSPPPAEEASPNWTSGRSSQGGGFDPGTMGTRGGLGAAGPPPGNPSGSVLTFGRYAGWSLGEIARRDVEFIEWLDRAPIGRQYRDEVDAILRAAGRRRTARAEPDRRGLFRRR